MLALKGIYQNGKITLEQEMTITDPVAVIVTFLEEPRSLPAGPLNLSEFSFAQVRELLKPLHSSLSDTLIAERREVL
jgi:hypothetical protein